MAVIDPDQPRPLWYKKEMPRWTVIDILGDLRRDLTRQVGADTRDQRSGNDIPRLHHIGRRGRHNAIRALGATIDVCTEEGEFAVLAVQGEGLVRGQRRWLARARYARRRTDQARLRGQRRRLANTGRCKQPAQARGLSFLGDLLLTRVYGRSWRRWRVLSIQYRPPEIAGQWRAEGWDLAGKAGIVLRQSRKPIGNVVMIGRIEFNWCRRVLSIVLQRP